MTNVSNAPLGVEVARCMAELRGDRSVLRAVRQLVAERRIELAQELNDTARLIEQAASVVKVVSQVAGKSDGASYAGELEKTLEKCFESLRQQAAELRASSTGDDLASQNSSESLRRLGDLKRGKRR